MTAEHNQSNVMFCLHQVVLQYGDVVSFIIAWRYYCIRFISRLTQTLKGQVCRCPLVIVSSNSCETFLWRSCAIPDSEIHRKKNKQTFFSRPSSEGCLHIWSDNNVILTSASVVAVQWSGSRDRNSMNAGSQAKIDIWVQARGWKLVGDGIAPSRCEDPRALPAETILRLHKQLQNLAD